MESNFLDSTIPAVQQMGEPWFYLGACALLCAFGDKKMYETGKLAAAAFLEMGSVVFALKHGIGRPRPEDTEENGTSFPSGHSAIAFTMATVAGYEYKKLRIPFYIAASGVAFARVIGGAAIGILAGMSVIHFRKPVLQLSF